MNLMELDEQAAMMQFMDTTECLCALSEFMAPHNVRVSYESSTPFLRVPVSDGVAWIQPGWWIIRSASGDLYTCNDATVLNEGRLDNDSNVAMSYVQSNHLE